MLCLFSTSPFVLVLPLLRLVLHSTLTQQIFSFEAIYDTTNLPEHNLEQ